MSRPELWSDLFGNQQPVEIEIGPGRGEVLRAFARDRPEVNFFAIEFVRGAAAALAERCRTDGLANVRVLAADAGFVVGHLVPDASVAAYHVYFPDPWPKRRHRKRRVCTPAFARALRRTLAPGGSVHVASDLAWLFDDIARALVAEGFARVGTPPARPSSKFEGKYATAGAYEATFAPAPPAAA